MLCGIGLAPATSASAPPRSRSWVAGNCPSPKTSTTRRQLHSCTSTFARFPYLRSQKHSGFLPSFLKQLGITSATFCEMAPPSGCLSWVRIRGRRDSENPPIPPTSTISDEPGVEASMTDDTRRLYNQAERPTSVLDAQKHIAQIRAEKGVGDPHGPSQDLVQALKL